MSKYIGFLFLFVSCNLASLKKKVELGNPIFKYINSSINSKKDSIEYAGNPVFKKGAFELKTFSIFEENFYYIFLIEMEDDFKNDWFLPGGWDTQIFDIYLNLGKGNNIQTLYGRKARIEEGWDKVILVSPLSISDIKKEVNEKNIEVFDSYSIIENLTKDVILPQEKFVNKNCLYIKVSKESIGSELTKFLKGLQLFIMCVDPKGEEHSIRKINTFANDKEFGSIFYDNNTPNIINILGDRNTREDLRSYEIDGDNIRFANIKLLPFKLEKLDEKK